MIVPPPLIPLTLLMALKLLMPVATTSCHFECFLTIFLTFFEKSCIFAVEKKEDYYYDNKNNSI